MTKLTIAKLLFLLFAFPCFKLNADSLSSLIEKDSTINISQFGTDDAPSSDLCHNFILSVTAIKEVFSVSKILSMKDIHDKYELLPCWIRGTIESRQGQYKWEIRAGGTGELTLPNGEVVLFGCKECIDGC